MVQLKVNTEPKFSVYMQFQFLMVQLKVEKSGVKRIAAQISIPYGSIKSELRRKYVVDPFIFQFLMVQLKA